MNSNSRNFISLSPRNLVVALALSIVLFVGLYFYIASLEDTYIDDAFIQFTYSSSIVNYNTWGFFPDRVANTATSPLNVILTAFIGFFSSSIINATTLLTTIEFFLLAIFLLLISKRLFDGYYFAVFAFLAFVTNLLLVSTLGLEGVLFSLLVIISIYLYVTQRWAFLFLSLALLTLTRADGFLLFVLYFLFIPISIRRKFKFALLYFLVLLPWFLYSWIQLGSFIPDSMIIKLGQEAWGNYTFFNGLRLYMDRFPLETILAYSLLPLGLLAIRRVEGPTKSIIIILGAYGLLHFMSYSILRVPPYHWYYIHQVIPIIIIGSIGITVFYYDAALKEKQISKIISYLALILPIGGMLIIAIRDGFPPVEAPIHTNWATHSQFKEVGLWLKENLDPSFSIFNTGEIGTLAFYSEQYVINEFSDRNIIMRSTANNKYQNFPIIGTFLKINFFWRHTQKPLPPIIYIIKHRSINSNEIELLEKDAIMSWDTSTKWVPRGRIFLLKSDTEESIGNSND